MSKISLKFPVSVELQVLEKADQSLLFELYTWENAFDGPGYLYFHPIARGFNIEMKGELYSELHLDSCCAEKARTSFEIERDKIFLCFQLIS